MYDSNDPAKGSPVSLWTWAAFVVALVTAGGSLTLTLVENKVACPLCFYQRSFALGVAALLGVGLLTRAAPASSLAALALPLALGGLGVAGFHVSLEERGILECPAGLGEMMTAPKQSAAAFGVLSLLLLIETLRGLSAGAAGVARLVLGLLLGGGIAYASTAANPPLSPAATKPYDGPPLTCRRPYTP